MRSREREREIVPTRSKSFLVINFHRGIYERRRYNLSSSARVNNRMEKGWELSDLSTDSRIGGRREETSNSYSAGGRHERQTEGSGGWKARSSIVVKFRPAIHSSFSARVFPPRGALKFQNVAIGRARMPTTFAASVCAAYAVPFVPTRIQKSIYIYDVSGLDDTATGYAGLEASPGGAGRNKMVEE